MDGKPTFCSRHECERELTYACDPISVVKRLALARVVLHADSVGGAAWGTHWQQSCEEGKTAEMKMVFI